MAWWNVMPSGTSFLASTCSSASIGGRKDGMSTATPFTLKRPFLGFLSRATSAIAPPRASHRELEKEPWQSNWCMSTSACYEQQDRATWKEAPSSHTLSRTSSKWPNSDEVRGNVHDEGSRNELAPKVPFVGAP